MARRQDLLGYYAQNLERFVWGSAARPRSMSSVVPDKLGMLIQLPGLGWPLLSSTLSKLECRS